MTDTVHGSSQPRALSQSSTFRWGFIGFLVSYVGCFLIPTFFSGDTMFAPEIVPSIGPIAGDLRTMLRWGAAWRDAAAPYHGYPPLTNALFAAWTLLPFPVLFALLSTATIGLLLSLALLLPRYYAGAGGVGALVGLIVGTSLFSYGVQLEIERGQFNMLAFGLASLGVWLFHAKPRWSFFAYALFSAGVQMKLYPAILGLLLIRDYRDHRSNVRRAIGLGLANFALLFAMGWTRFLEFASALGRLTDEYSGGYTLNHSISSFAAFVTTTLGRHMTIPASAGAVVESVLMLYLFGCLFAIVALNYRDRRTGIDPYLFLACTIAAMAIPTVSLDYKLAMLVAPLALAVTEFERWASESDASPAGNAALMVMLAAYGTTLFTYKLKPTALDNNGLALVVILGCVTAMAQMRSSTAQHARRETTS